SVDRCCPTAAPWLPPWETAWQRIGCELIAARRHGRAKGLACKRQIKKSPPGRRARLSLASRKLQDVSPYSLELVLHAHTEGGVVTVFGTGGIRFIGHLGEVGVDLGGLGQCVVGANRHQSGFVVTLIAFGQAILSFQLPAVDFVGTADQEGVLFAFTG